MSVTKKSKIYKKLFSTEAGKFVLADIYKFCRISSPSYVEGYKDKTAYNEGAKSFAYYIKTVLKQDTLDVDKFLAEQRKLTNYNPLKK
jgi:hypothetical protein